MSTIVTRAGKGSPLTHTEMDANFTNLNTDKLETADLANYLQTDDVAVVSNKTIDLTDNTVTGTLAEFNTALSDANFASLAGTETLSNKTFSDAITVAEVAAPATPASGFAAVYVKTDGLLYVKDDAGVERTSSVVDASTSAKGIVELATEVEVITGTSTTLVPSVDAFRKANIVAGTAVASTSGTAIDFTGIPSWAKRIVVMFTGVSTNGTDFIQIQVGAGSVTTTGYSATNVTFSASSLGGTSSTTGFQLSTASTSAATHTGALTLSLFGSNTWVASGSFSMSTTNVANLTQGSIALGGALDRVRVTTTGGTNTFDAGSINILYE